MINIDWQQIIAYLLLAVSGLGGLAWGGKTALMKFRSGIPVKTRTPATVDPETRSSDTPAPPGALEWVADISIAMGGATAESKLKAIQKGCTRDQARGLRIAELEGVAP